MTEESIPAGEETVRVEDFEAEGPIEVDVSVGIGRVTIELTDESGVHAEVRRDGGEQQPWVDGMTSLLSWVGERFGDQLGGSPVGSAGDAVAQTRIEKVGNRLVVQAPKAWQLKNVPLAVTVRAPAGSHLEVRAGAADVTVTGVAGRADLMTGAGKISLERADGSAIVRTGTGDIKVGATLSSLQLRTGSGAVEASSLCGSATIATGTGDVWLGEIAGEVLARTGSGDLSVTDAAFGALELTTGSGEVRVAIRGRVRAEIDLSSTTGSVSSELDVAESAPSDGEVVLKVRARTGTGDAVVTSAAS